MDVTVSAHGDDFFLSIKLCSNKKEIQLLGSPNSIVVLLLLPNVIRQWDNEDRHLTVWFVPRCKYTGR